MSVFLAVLGALWVFTALVCVGIKLKDSEGEGFMIGITTVIVCFLIAPIFLGVIVEVVVNKVEEK